MEEDTASTFLGSVLSLSLWGLRIVLPATAFWFYRQGGGRRKEKPFFRTRDADAASCVDQHGEMKGEEQDETSEQHDHGLSSRSKDGLRENPEKNEEVAALSSMHKMSSEVTTSGVTGTAATKTSSSTCSSTSTSCSVSPANNTSTSEQEARHGGCGSDNEFREKKNLTKDQAAQEQLKALSKANLAGIEKLYKEMLTEEQEKEEGREIYSRKTFQMLAETCLEAAKWYDQQSVAEPAFWKTPKKMHRGESPSAVGAYHSPSTRTVASSGYHSHQGTPLPSYQSTPLHGNKQQSTSSPEKNTINDLLALVGGQKGGNGKDENNYPPAIYSASEHGEHYWAAANPEYWHSTWSAAHASAAAAHHLTTSGAPDLPHHHHLSPHYHPHHLAASTTLAPYWNAASHPRSYLDPANYWAIAGSGSNVANHHGNQNWERTSTTVTSAVVADKSSSSSTQQQEQEQGTTSTSTKTTKCGGVEGDVAEGDAAAGGRPSSITSGGTASSSEENKNDSQSTTEGKASTGVEVAAVDQHTAAKTETASTSSADQFQ